MLPKIGICICFTLCWILLYCSWRISEITSAVSCKAVMRNSLTYPCSLWRTPCTKRSPCACTWRQRGGVLVTALPGGGKQDRTFPAPSAPSPSIWDRWCGPGIPAPTLWELQQRSPGSLGHPHLLPCSPSPAPSAPGAAWAALQQGVCHPVSLQPHCPHLIQFLASLQVVPSVPPCPAPQAQCM